jgi:hypothetical protein
MTFCTCGWFGVHDVDAFAMLNFERVTVAREDEEVKHDS